jgi:hypothetical protein
LKEKMLIINTLSKERKSVLNNAYTELKSHKAKLIMAYNAEQPIAAIASKTYQGFSEIFKGFVIEYKV